MTMLSAVAAAEEAKLKVRWFRLQLAAESMFWGGEDRGSQQQRRVDETQRDVARTCKSIAQLDRGGKQTVFDRRGRGKLLMCCECYECRKFPV